ncbi:MAG: poly[(R)-3-hydroxyalkanoate] polymerase subunit PhaC, partial [Solirubrobacteraceae bacterium]|nr:poly[(R)-3-hydroxyalkanoate] polymerase subunit PhaC [Solirubrobacteraceae bacterium]
YAPTTAQVAGTPLLLISSQVNKFYIADLAPDRSMVEFTTAQGLPTFAISWRNPEREQADWGFATYMAACKEAVDAVLAISGAERLHLAGICGGGIMVSMLLAHLAATDDERVASGTLMVTHLDQAVQTLASVLVADPVIAAAKRRSRRAGILDGRDTARFFAWLRPNELVWSYVVNNWLLGDDPPQHELLFWNVDNTRLPAQLHVDYLDLYLKNALVHPGALEVLGTPIDLSAVRTDTYLVGGTTDHITPWRGCHRSAALLGGDSQFVLSVGGHVGTIVSAIGNQRARHFAGPVTGDDPDAWSAAAEEHAGSWWPHWAAWLGERSAPPRRAARRLGNRRFPALESAPGSYVL